MEDFYNSLNKIHNICQEYLEEEYGDNAASSFGDILYYKQIEYVNGKGKTKKKKDESASPVLYVKLIYSDKTKKYYLYSEPKEIKMLIHSIISINVLIQKWH